MNRSKPVALITVIVAVALGSCATAPPMSVAPQAAEVKDYYIVDCLLPGQIRRLGNKTYVTARRPTRTTAVDCNIRGGEYVAFDRADYKTALRVWLPAAEEGDAEAQNAVGEIFERGLGTEPNEELAAVWYRRAAEQGYKAAQVNLAMLYEVGRGVPRDQRIAMNWYRRAWGIADDELVLRSEVEADAHARARAMAEAERKAEAQRRAEAEREAAAARKAEAARRTESARKAPAQRAKATSATGDEDKTKQGESSNPVSDNSGQGFTAIMPPDAPSVRAKGREFGRYFALIIGNAEYENLSPLETPVADGRRLAEVLTDNYQFSLQLISNGDDVAMLRALNQLNEVLREEDNLLIFYSGHGNRRSSATYSSGYWLPINAQAPPDDTFWVPTEQVTGHLARLKARRILVIADSAFAGLLADNPAFLFASDPAMLRSDPYIDLRLPNRARLLM
ncbi:MAG: caspase family protein, partial [Pseudomonadota bacterium]